MQWHQPTFVSQIYTAALANIREQGLAPTKILIPK